MSAQMHRLHHNSSRNGNALTPWNDFHDGFGEGMHIFDMFAPDESRETSFLSKGKPHLIAFNLSSDPFLIVEKLAQIMHAH